MNAYDEIAYPGYPFRHAHPDRMAVVARLLGVEPASASRCRVLEVACGDGGNLIPMAYALPESEFTGIDLAAAPIARGQAFVRELGLRNVRLAAMDVDDVGADFGEFDYIIVYGLYSWVPEPVRQAVLRVIGGHLAPQGVAYVNYNAHPGGHLRVMLREMMLFHTRGIEGPRECIAAAQNFLRTLSGSPLLTDAYGAMVKAEAARLLERDGAFLYHDELAPVYEPCRFTEFAAAAAAHGLQYLAEATLSDTHAIDGPAAEWLDKIPDLLEREQYLDFLKYRSFRQTLLCRADLALERTLRACDVASFWVASKASVRMAGGETEFKTARATLRTTHPLACAVLGAVCGEWPRAISVEDLIAKTGAGTREAVCTILLRAFTGEIVELYGVPPVAAAHAGELPKTNSLVRLQAREGTAVTTPFHTYIELRDESARRLIQLLDGTRDRAALRREMGPRVTANELDEHLDELVRLGLLEER